MGTINIVRGSMRGIYCAVVLENTATLRYVFLMYEVRQASSSSKTDERQHRTQTNTLSVNNCVKITAILLNILFLKYKYRISRHCFTNLQNTVYINAVNCKEIGH